jgi:uncharacterized protein
MKTYAFRLKPGKDLKLGIEDFVAEKGLKAALVITCVGGLESLTIRMAGATPGSQNVKTLTEDFEVVSLVGTTGKDGCHFHIAASTRDGQVIGGHLKEGTVVNPTAEVVLGELEGAVFSREMDDDTGFEELVVKHS